MLRSKAWRTKRKKKGVNEEMKVGMIREEEEEESCLSKILSCPSGCIYCGLTEQIKRKQNQKKEKKKRNKTEEGRKGNPSSNLSL